ncbi:MAG TPA: META domain-containing protein [Candidatus Krumholzibacteria bacterium]|nr:META domain-containing protein [Candidatus Krumholzibacteria bacterium]
MLTALLAVAACGGKPAVQAAGDPLADSAWSLATLPGIALAADVTVTLQFHEGLIGGSAGCNRYSASYEVRGDSLVLGPAGATKMLCPEPQMVAEDAFLAALARVRTFHRSGDRLELRPDAGEPLVFAAAPYPAVEP